MMILVSAEKGENNISHLMLNLLIFFTPAISHFDTTVYLMEIGFKTEFDLQTY